MGDVKEKIDHSKLTKDQLWELERANQTPAERAKIFLTSMAPFFGFAIALAEYLLVPNLLPNDHAERYVIFLCIPLLFYFVKWVGAVAALKKGNNRRLWDVKHSAPFLCAIFLFLALLDYSTLKTGKLLYPYIPWVNDIINVAIMDWQQLLISSLYTLRLLMLGYLWGVVLGLITGIACGYNEKVRYWIQPIVKVLGPIPTATWIPLIMLLASSLFAGSIFIVGLGTWFAVTVATMTGIMNIEPSYFHVARTLGATERQLVFHIAIPHAMPNILAGMTQGMSSACVSLMIAEMMGVKAGLGWYMTWAKSWAAYNKMFAAIIVICIIFNLVTKGLDAFKNYVLRWKTEGDA